MLKINIGFILKYILLVLSIISYNTLLAIEMPPAPPSLVDKNIKVTTTKYIKIKKANILPIECQLLPPSTILIPPPMENLVGQCKNKLFKPTIINSKNNIDKLFGKNAKISSINIINEFNNLYEVTVNKKMYLCNKTISACFKKSKIIR